MQAVSFGPHRGADWLNRVALDLTSRAAGCERFTLIAQDPLQPRTLWVSLSLSRAQGVLSCACAAIYVDGATGEQWLAEEAWPEDRMRVDPSRGGLGVGECNLGDGQSQGLIRGDTFAIAWALNAPWAGGPRGLLPSPWLYCGGRLGAKVALGAPAHPAQGGHIEVWRTLGRYAHRSRIDCAGWSVSQTHAFGGAAPSAYVHLHVPPGEAQALDLFATETRLWRLWPTTLVMAAHQRPGGAAPDQARAWRYGGILPTPGSVAAPWQFTLQARQSTWRGEVLAAANEVVHLRQAPHGGAHAVAVGATVQASITGADGHIATVASTRSIVEVGGARVAERDA